MFVITVQVALAVTLIGFFIKIPRYTLANGYVTTYDWAEVRPPVSGVVKAIHVKTGATVKAGDLLVELNSEVEEANLAEAQTTLQQLKSNKDKRIVEMAPSSAAPPPDGFLKRRTASVAVAFSCPPLSPPPSFAI